MRTILILIKKEFLQVFRNSLLWKILILGPLAEFLIFPFTADYEIKHVHIAFVDYDRSSTTAEIVSKFSASQYFISHGTKSSKEQVLQDMKHDKIDFIVEFPQDFEKSLVTQQPVQIGITANAINTVKAGLGAEYVQNVLADYFNDLLQHTPTTQQHAQLLSTNVYWYNENMNYKNLIVPGVLIILVTLIGAYVTALNLVREKEIGTIEQINVTPIKRWQFLLGKMIPFWILGMAEFSVGLIIMFIVFGISIQGSLLLLLGLTALYLLVMLGLGFFISSISENQLQAMFIVFFLFILFVMLGGIFTPSEGMPTWAKYLNYFNPISFFVVAVKTIILKGSTIESIEPQLIALSVMAVILNTAALLSYRDKVK